MVSPIFRTALLQKRHWFVRRERRMFFPQLGWFQFSYSAGMVLDVGCLEGEISKPSICRPAVRLKNPTNLPFWKKKMLLWRSDGNPLSWILFLTVKHRCYFFPEFMWWFVHQGAGHSQQRIRVDAWMCRDLPNSKFREDLHIHFYIKIYTPPKTNNKFFPLKKWLGLGGPKPFIFGFCTSPIFRGPKSPAFYESRPRRGDRNEPLMDRGLGGETEKDRFSSLKFSLFFYKFK